MAAKKKKGRLEEWFDLPRDQVAKRTAIFIKAYGAHKAEEPYVVADPLFAHKEYIEQAELRAEQIKDVNINKRQKKTNEQTD